MLEEGEYRPRVYLRLGWARCGRGHKLGLYLLKFLEKNFFLFCPLAFSVKDLGFSTEFAPLFTVVEAIFRS